jgi:hypothetical protein
MDRVEIGLRLYTKSDLGNALRGIQRAFAADSELAPRAIRASPRYLDPASRPAEDMWRRAAEAAGDIDMIQRLPHHIDVQVRFGRHKTRPFHTLEWELFASQLEHSTRRIEALFRSLVVATSAHFGAAFSREDLERQHSDPASQRMRAGLDLARTALPGLYWLNYLGPELAEFIGRDKVRAAHPSAEQVGDGLFLRLARNPGEMLQPAGRFRTKKLRAALGESLCFDLEHADRTGPHPSHGQLLDPIDIDPPVRAEIRNPTAFAKTARTRAAAWRLRRGAPPDREATLALLEEEMRRLNPLKMSYAEFEDLVAVFGELSFPDGQSEWVPCAFGALVVPHDGGAPKDPVDAIQFFFHSGGHESAPPRDWTSGSQSLPPAPALVEVDLLVDDDEDTLAQAEETVDTDDVNSAPSTDDIDTDDLGKK